ncbi:hypothetical protein HZH68_008335 [Vespula germanica]|uniref:Uncharacterized protein n=1 Tax=Vespula germanica TaxID=30212 RepID=A0A834K3T7_VESGE|nr:hypothetical protein HZH68_008335 [Vespula germanica]
MSYKVLSRKHRKLGCHCVGGSITEDLTVPRWRISIIPKLQEESLKGLKERKTEVYRQAESTLMCLPLASAYPEASLGNEIPLPSPHFLDFSGPNPRSKHHKESVIFGSSLKVTEQLWKFQLSVVLLISSQLGDLTASVLVNKED